MPQAIHNIMLKVNPVASNLIKNKRIPELITNSSVAKRAKECNYIILLGNSNGNKQQSRTTYLYS